MDKAGKIVTIILWVFAHYFSSPRYFNDGKHQ
jgi:hypothetical protein